MDINDYAAYQEREFKVTAEALKFKAEQAIRDMQRVIRECDNAIAGEPYSINSLGESQSVGREVDRLCAVLHERSMFFGTIQHIAAREG